MGQTGLALDDIHPNGSIRGIVGWLDFFNFTKDAQSGLTIEDVLKSWGVAT